jgi:hypothetical protein
MFRHGQPAKFQKSNRQFQRGQRKKAVLERKGRQDINMLTNRRNSILLWTGQPNVNLILPMTKVIKTNPDTIQNQIKKEKAEENVWEKK